MRRVAGGMLVLVMTAAAGFAGACSRAGSAPPGGWTVTTDSSGSCEVATPPDWRVGREFFLKKEAADIRSTPQGRQAFPPRGFALWQSDGRDATKPAATGKTFQTRRSSVRGEEVCSVWRIKQGADFTADEQTVMQQVGQTLRWVR